MLKNQIIRINGQVQGVGFRPYVYNLALKFKLKGYVTNNAEGVVIEVSGEKNQLKAFYCELINHPPPVSRIQDHKITDAESKEFDRFKIIPSQKENKLNLQLTPDFALCKSCSKEISDPANRRFEYAFTTCVNCGPRWSITKTFPFERDHTSLASFSMCESCTIEYTDPSNRRFHSQTNSCRSCGMEIQLIDASNGEKLASDSSVFVEVARLISRGQIIALKNTGGYLLCCDACDPLVVSKLRRLKRRPAKPFAIMFPDLESIESDFRINSSHKKALTGVERPIVILSMKGATTNLALSEIAPKLNQIGLMLPYSGILQLLARHLKGPVVATSGNLHGSPILSDQKEVEEYLTGIADYFVHHNMPILNAQDDSVVKFSFKFDQEVLFRRSRGYAPNYYTNDFELKENILALGGHLKSSIAFVPNRYLYLSQYLGNLDHFDVYQRFVQTSRQFMELFEEKPDLVLVDQHPAYQSTIFGNELARELKAELVTIQHHKAHFAAVLGEHQLFQKNETVLGVIWDGTGYGEDEQIWGGEFFSYEKGSIKREGHLSYFNWIAADKMATEPRLSALSLSQDPEKLRDKFEKNEFEIFKKLKAKSRLQTSSMGRMFDAVASYLGLCDLNSYEGEAAIIMENALEHYELNRCRPYCSLGDDHQIPTQLFWDNLCADFDKSKDIKETIANFLFTLCRLILEMADQLKVESIALSGGVFQNTTLIDMLNELAGNRMKLYFNLNLAPNDENISYGQVMYYLNCQ